MKISINTRRSLKMPTDEITEIDLQDAEEIKEPETPQEPTEPADPKKNNEAPRTIAVDQKSQLIVARDNSELYRMVQTFMKGKAFPKSIDTVEKALAAWQVAASLNLPPIIVMQNLMIVHGNISMWGQLPKALAERTGELKEFKLTLFDANQKVISLENKNLGEDVWGASVQIKRGDRSTNEYSFTEVDAKKAGLLDKAGPWKQYKKIMYARRAVGNAIKFEFPDALMGVPIAEYDFNMAPDLKDVTPSQTSDEIAKSLADRAKTIRED